MDYELMGAVARDSAKRGADVLDKHFPGWQDGIDLASVDISSCKRCLLGQLFGTYAKGIEAIRQVEPLGVLTTVQLGFCHPPMLTIGQREHYYERLYDAWATEVMSRVEADPCLVLTSK